MPTGKCWPVGRETAWCLTLDSMGCVRVLLIPQAAYHCETAVMDFSRAASAGGSSRRGERVAISSHYPVDVLALVRLKLPGQAGPVPQRDGTATVADNSDDDDDATTGSIQGDFAFVRVYDYVFPPGDGAAGVHTMFTHEAVPSCEYMCLTDIYELVPVNQLLRPAVMVPNTTQRSPRDAMQYGYDTRRASKVPRVDHVFTHYFWMKYLF